MMITGIYSTLQVRDRNVLRTFWGSRKRFSITLYDQVMKEPDAEELAERILLPFADERGAYKRTYARRYEEFDASVLSYLAENLHHDEPLVIQDVAISDGRTSCDFFEKVVKLFPRLSFFASDYDPIVVVVEDGSARVALSRAGRLLECVWPPFVFNALKKDSRLCFPLNRLIQFFVERTIARRIMAEYARGDLAGRELLLFSPRALALAESDRRFHLGQHDLLKPFVCPCHVVRAMNVLNLSYFNEPDRCRVVGNIHAGLLDRGFLIAGSNQEAGSRVHGGIYRRTPAGFERTWLSGNGCPLDKEIMTFRVR